MRPPPIPAVAVDTDVLTPRYALTVNLRAFPDDPPT